MSKAYGAPEQAKIKQIIAEGSRDTCIDKSLP